MNKSIKKNTGQGLLEATVAVGIIMIAVVASLTLIISSIQAGQGVRERMIATNLAREGLEAVRSIRDSNWLASRVWTYGWVSPANPSLWIPKLSVVPMTQSDCLIPAPLCPEIGQRWVLQTAAAVNKVYLKNGLYVQAAVQPSGSSDTGFKRKIIVTQQAANKEYKVESLVEWSQRGQNRSVTLQDTLTDWKP